MYLTNSLAFIFFVTINTIPPNPPYSRGEKKLLIFPAPLAQNWERGWGWGHEVVGRSKIAIEH